MTKKEILVDGEVVYLKKDNLFGWRVYEPATKWYHYIFGSKKNLIMLIIIMAIAIMLYFGINEMISAYKTIAANPCLYCKTCNNPNPVLTNLTIS